MAKPAISHVATGFQLVLNGVGCTTPAGTGRSAGA